MCKILDDVKAVELLSPIKRKNPTVRLPNAKKHCKYHSNWTHNINECVTSKNEIEDPIHKGYYDNTRNLTKANLNKPTN